MEPLKYKKCENAKQCSVPKPIFDLIEHWNTCWNTDISYKSTFQIHLTDRRITARQLHLNALLPLYPSTVLREDILCAHTASEERPSLHAKLTHKCLIWACKQYSPFNSYNWKNENSVFLLFSSLYYFSLAMQWNCLREWTRSGLLSFYA